MQKKIKPISLLCSIMIHLFLLLFLFKERAAPEKIQQSIRFSVNIAVEKLNQPQLIKELKIKDTKIAQKSLAVDNKSSIENKELNSKPLTPSVLPKLINSVEIKKLLKKYYPEDMRQNQEEGQVKLAITIESNGNVSKIKIIKSAGTSFDKAAIKVVQLMKFQPAMRDNQPMALKVSKTIHFHF